jgi:DNA-binding response OmpR family regulator
MRLLVVEDNQRLQELLADSLKGAGYGVDVAGTMADFLGSVAAVQYDLVIVDLGLPDGDGLSGIRALREQGQSMPVLVITARGSIEDRVSGLDGGADDYLIKPFNHTEFLARVRACCADRPSSTVLFYAGVISNSTRPMARPAAREDPLTCGSANADCLPYSCAEAAA